MPKAAASKSKSCFTVGWREWIAFPEFWDGAIKAKIDTGARTSAIHAFNTRTVRRGDQRFVRFEIHPVQHRKMPAVSCIAKFHDQRYVTSSNGIREKRYIIVTKLKIGANFWPIELALTNRDEMGFRVLIGRQALRGHAVVDPGRSYLARL